ncbi:ABC transporter permease subunit [Anaerotruncus sp. AF02-27]|jgi:NitT/TauT family transport system permease protein|uniref:ABC transporter permease n=1 Tax=Anaerotruncus TaxID=244127 RepID=UPI000E506CB6|nr:MULTISPECIES: ABC transporter permease subunit [Anaerotruncus]RGX55548.1 ABC transporter permease subunit [Anaerotruncus sp. AF02-27]
MKTSTSSDKHPFPTRIIVIVLWLLLWQAAYLAVGEDLLLASPAATLVRVAQLAVSGSFWGIIVQSLGRILTGFLLGLVCGTAVAFATAHSRWAHAFVSLPMNIIKATPVASFVILALVWISGKNLSVFIAFLMVLPLVWSNVHQGIKSTDPKLLEMAKVFRLPHASVLRSITVPAALPYFLSAARVGLGFSWKAGIAGEVIAIPTAAIGTQLYNAKVYLETVDLFAWTAVIILLSVLLERMMLVGFDALTKRLNRMKREVRE